MVNELFFKESSKMTIEPRDIKQLRKDTRDEL